MKIISKPKKVGPREYRFEGFVYFLGLVIPWAVGLVEIVRWAI